MRSASATTSQKGWRDVRSPRPPLLAGLAVVAALAATAITRSAPRAAGPTPLARAVEAVGMTVANMDRSVAFFTDVLTFRKVADDEVSGEAYDRLHGVFASRLRIVRLRLGGEEVELTEYLTPRGRPVPIDSRSNDRWFQHVAIIVSDMDAAYAHLRRHGVEHSSPEPQRLPDWNPAAGGIKAFYFKDPDGHPLEILQFPTGKGDPKWARAGGRLFLGIDHTAIVVGDTEASLRFYRDLLGLRLAGQSVNYGPEQERLNAVFGARLHISGLRADAGPGVEFLEYLSPRNGRPSSSIQANDLAHWETTVTTTDAYHAFDQLRTGDWLISPAVVAVGAPGRAAANSILVRDPDGHSVKVVER
jgi:catechol 2,3-dioxygenase-like lactoylglutathione lyase family enzyme